MRFRQWDSLAEKEVQIRWQWVLIGFLCLSSLGLGWGWYQAPKHVTLYVPPDLSEGALISPGTVPKPVVYSFAFHVWQALQQWPTAHAQGPSACARNIHTYWAYLTPRFRAELLAHCHTLAKHGQLQRVRHLISLPDNRYQPTFVKALDANSWQVNLRFHLVEYVDQMRVKNIDVRYPLRVVRYRISHTANPYGLALAGFAGATTRLTPSTLKRSSDE